MLRLEFLDRGHHCHHKGIAGIATTGKRTSFSCILDLDVLDMPAEPLKGLQEIEQYIPMFFHMELTVSTQTDIRDPLLWHPKELKTMDFRMGKSRKILYSLGPQNHEKWRF